jgi:hypothetical protein
MAIPPRLAKELGELDAPPEIVEEAAAVSLIFRNFPIPPGYNRVAADLLLRIPRAYPDAGPDMFWTTSALTLADGSPPKNSEVVESLLGESWRRFSWHTNWRPNVDNLHGHIQVVRRRLEQAC